MTFIKYFSLVIVLTIVSCVGNDFVDDFVEPQLRIINSVETLAVGDSYPFQAQFFNNVGLTEEAVINWESSDESIASVSDQGLITGLSKGSVIISAFLRYEGSFIRSSIDLIVDQETVAAASERFGSLQTTSFYNLRGDFVLSEIDGGVRLTIEDNYFTDDALPGLYIYLTNNPNSIRDAQEIDEVTIFEGSHSYDVLDVGLNDYSHVLYFCKPFNVKVGDGEIE